MYGYKAYNHEVTFWVRRGGGLDWSGYTIHVRTKHPGRIADLVLAFAMRREPKLTKFDVLITSVGIV
jgi:hypothetical protein